MFVRADASLIRPIARMNSRGKRRLLMGKFSRARCVCAPYKAWAGTATSPIESRSIRLLWTFPAIDFIRKTGATKTNAIGDQTLPLNPGKLARSPDFASGADHPMPGQPCRTAAHGRRDLAGTRTDKAGNVSVGQYPATRYAPDQPIYGMADIRIH